MTLIKSQYELDKLTRKAEKNIDNGETYSLEEVYKIVILNQSK